MKMTIFRAAVMAAGVLLLGAAPQVAADNCCTPCCDPCWDPCSCDGQWGVGAHALIWRPLDCQYDYARQIAFDLNGVGMAHSANQSVKGDYDWGFKVWGQYCGDCLFAKIGYTWFETSASNSIESNELDIWTEFGIHPNPLVPDGPALVGFAGDFAEAHVRHEYQNVDIRLGSRMSEGCCGCFFMFGNIRWVDLTEKRAARLETPIGPVAAVEAVHLTKSTYEGAGLGFGVGGSAVICDNFHLFGEANVMGIIGSRKTPVSALFAEFEDSVIDVLELEESYGTETCVIPELDAKIGFSYTYCCDCWTFVAEVGYEVNYFWNAFAARDGLPGLVGNNQQEFPPITAQPGELNFARTCRDIGFAGPFFGARVLF